MSNELFLEIAILVVDIAILVVVALESYLAITAALKSRSALKSRRKRVYLKSVLNFVTPDGVLSTKPLTIPVKPTKRLKIRKI
jgi:hypothetical protein